MSGSRKDDHLALAARQQREAHGEPPQPTDATSQAPDDASSVSSPRPAGSDSTYCAWDDVRILHHSLAGIDPGQADISTNIPTDRSGRNTSSGVHTAQPLHWGLPFYINGMTGGSELTAGVNRVLAETAARTGIAVATGSMSIFLREPDTLPTFRILRDRNPHGTVWANLSADATPDDAARVVDALQADALQIHVNAVQETVMPEGSRGYASWPRNIEAIVNALEVTHTPVIVKEVGFGMTRNTLQQLHDLGVSIADVSGRGGTNFARIENDRRSDRDFSYLTGFGQSAAFSLLDATTADLDTLPTLFASGGVRQPYDVLRGLALGADAVGVAGTFLHTALSTGVGDAVRSPQERAQGVDAAVDALTSQINRWAEHLQALYEMVGATSTSDLHNTDALITGPLAESARARGIDLTTVANRRR
ncbi:alpha-hydroxy-acid oxidizing protein [Corynebacterium pseudokroppenstedtii]|uniref:Isopentenyl-diphosphate delta-isomerase n=1 Tax=Corynebacterium pseudokroppenstedtii TaxID=2804917 RepID=A0AAU0PXK9_9CORY|nr:alpha-hydroxy-acid oxidizing protein [Corynebacterium pseudokroppenstedtii]MDU7503561.1 alpha-hydroxy-acid oxidizing protein [Corynebacterium kroppenstedtii]MBY0790587.1 type 2 isopentenyl-diphosphate Delta-isomerase [Corynebacterium pseudokroppenstedtii]MCF6792872.1 alpha-hydroxy-acid oxidizing protein [Corynebacterium pseudokroppenstedtii]MCF8702337.1 alpha-hydroxy-acid oxidizing protein [Corynebacterium pseudokroppenstedtii]MCG2635522.1 alpha-hydroxy-acid oxidizing protein [Corynebacteri